jgi:uncharacterized membrane protein YphA (DoxX/SURF4 family)
MRFGDQVLRYTLAIVIGWLAMRTLMHIPGHMPRILILVIAGLELIACVLFALPKVAYTGGGLLFATLIAAIVVHALHRQYGVEDLVVYAAATFAVVTKTSG